MSSADLTSEELDRYQRQIGPGVLALDGQRRLKAATVLVTRAGGMGGPAALMLTMGGVGHVILAHGGVLISPDLNRQVLGAEAAVGKPRAPEFAARLRSMNRFAEIEAVGHEPDDAEALQLARRCDAILSCPPTFGERLRLNQAAVAAGTPLIDAAQWGLGGTLCVIRPGETACLQCLYPEPPPFEEDFPVVGAISAALGSLAALEAIKIVSRCGQVLWGKMLNYDGYRGGVSIVQLTRRPDCPCCAAVT